MPAVGAVISCVTITLAVDVQPFAAVAVTVYVPTAEMLVAADEPKPLLHTYEVPPVAATLIEVRKQFNIVEPVLFVMPTVGAVIFCVIAMLDVEVQPFNPVAVTV